jgi:hypothetical protein
MFPSSRSADTFREWYEDYRERMGTRPTALEAHGSGYNPGALRRTHGGWFAFVDAMGDLRNGREEAWRNHEAFLDELETTPMTRSYKMVVLQAMLWIDAFPGRVQLDTLTNTVARIVGRSALLRQNFSVDVDDAAALRALLVEHPVAAWTGRTDASGRPYFAFDGEWFATGTPLQARDRDALCELVAELVEYRLARYLGEHGQGARFRVLRNPSGAPILKIDRRKHELPDGWVDVEIDGGAYEANFVKEFVNVVRPRGQSENVLPEVMYRWFGDDAGRPGTAFGVSHAAEEGGGYRWTPLQPRKPTEGRALRDDAGHEMDARFVVEADPSGMATIVLMSGGGGRNKAYNRGLEVILKRLARAGLAITRIAVESSETRTLDLDARTVRVDGSPYPIPLDTPRRDRPTQAHRPGDRRRRPPARCEGFRQCEQARAPVHPGCQRRRPRCHHRPASVGSR